MDIKLPKITRAKLVLTEKCQLKCTYCYEKHGNKNMSLDIAKSVIDEIIRNAVSECKLPRITFFGGEPLLVYEELMKPCIEYIRYEKKSRCSIGFTTNGILLDEEKLKFFRDNDVVFMLSIDGCKESHNTHRKDSKGEGSFSLIESKIPLILKYFPNTCARMTITPETVHYLYESIRYIQEAGFIDMHIIPDLFVLEGGKSWDDNSFKEFEEQLNKFESYVIDTFESYEIPLIFQTYADMFTRMVLSNHCGKLNHHRTANCCLPTNRCGIGVDDHIIVDINGNYFSCQHSSESLSKSNPLYIGSIEEGILEERRLALLEMNSSPLRSDTLDCEECPLNNICTGGCAPNNYALSGDFTEVPVSYCRWSTLLYESAIRVVKYFDWKKDNDLFKDYFYGIVKRGVRCVC